MIASLCVCMHPISVAATIPGTSVHIFLDTTQDIMTSSTCRIHRVLRPVSNLVKKFDFYCKFGLGIKPSNCVPKVPFMVIVSPYVGKVQICNKFFFFF